MPSKTIEQLPHVSHNEVKPLYSKEEILDKLATAVASLRDENARNEQRIELELLYSIAKAALK